MMLNGVKSFLRLKDVTNTCKRMQHSPTIVQMPLGSKMAHYGCQMNV